MVTVSGRQGEEGMGGMHVHMDVYISLSSTTRPSIDLRYWLAHAASTCINYPISLEEEGGEGGSRYHYLYP
jgi:hypothetical protein